MGNRFVEILLVAVFTAVYFAVLFFFIKYLFARLPVNFVLDLLSLVMCVMAFVFSVGMADRTVAFIKERL